MVEVEVKVECDYFVGSMPGSGYDPKRQPSEEECQTERDHTNDTHRHAQPENNAKLLHTMQAGGYMIAQGE